MPHCEECGGRIKPDVVLYGESLDEKTLVGAADNPFRSMLRRAQSSDGRERSTVVVLLSHCIISRYGKM